MSVMVDNNVTKSKQDIHSSTNMLVMIDDQLTANLSMPRSVITKLPFSPLVRNLDI